MTFVKLIHDIHILQLMKKIEPQITTVLKIPTWYKSNNLKI